MKTIEWIQYYYRKLFVKYPGAMDNPHPMEIKARAPLNIHIPVIRDIYGDAKRLCFKMAKQSVNACTAYGRIHMAEIENTIGNNKLVLLDKELQWAHQINTGGSKKSGDLIQNAMKQFHNNPQGYPETEWRSIDNDLHEVLTWLALDRPILTGIRWKWILSERTDNYHIMRKTGVFVPGTGKTLGGHCVVIVGYNLETRQFKIIESELDEWGDNEDGVFYVNFEDLPSMMSLYISFDAKDQSQN